MLKVGGEKKELLAHIWCQIIDGKKRGKVEMHMAVQAFSSHLLRPHNVPRLFFDFEFAKTHSASFFPLSLNPPMVTSWWYMRCYTIAVVHVESIEAGHFLKCPLTFILSVLSNLASPFFLSLSPPSLPLSISPTLHLNVLITWGDAALMLTLSKRQNLLFIYLH